MWSNIDGCGPYRGVCVRVSWLIHWIYIPFPPSRWDHSGKKSPDYSGRFQSFQILSTPGYFPESWMLLFSPKIVGFSGSQVRLSQCYQWHASPFRKIQGKPPLFYLNSVFLLRAMLEILWCTFYKKNPLGVITKKKECATKIAPPTATKSFLSKINTSVAPCPASAFTNKGY